MNMHNIPTAGDNLSSYDSRDAADWWRGAVIYQIYPRSFQDSNGDGIGDLNGITQRLPYVAQLGVDAIWLSPFFTSPMRDFGYDVSDYENVDEMFGTLDDFDRLVAEAHRLGLRVMIDQVISHASDQHPWFVESRLDKTNDKADWFVWADAKEDGTPPNNWLSIFGGSAWEWETNRCQFYLHNFLASQPDLNFHNPHVQDALLDTVRFWLDRGVDGFRLDTINFYFHSQGLEDNPPLPLELRNDSTAPAVNPYNYQSHLFDKSQPENIAFLKRFRALLDEYPNTAAVGEVGDGERGLELVAQYTSGDDMVHMCYAFDFLSPDPLTAARVHKVVSDFEEAAPDGWSCWAFSNHDVMRHTSRWAAQYSDPDAFQKAALMLILTLRGSVCLYQGEELGLPEADIEFEDLQDPYGQRFWPKYKGRDGCRTPMVWSHNEASGGFSNSRPWLPVSKTHQDLAASGQEAGGESMLNFYRDALAFRARYREFAKGQILFGDPHDGVICYERSHDGWSTHVAINLSENTAILAAPDISFEQLDTPGIQAILRGSELEMPAFSVFMARRKDDREPEIET